MSLQPNFLIFLELILFGKTEIGIPRKNYILTSPHN